MSWLLIQLPKNCCITPRNPRLLYVCNQKSTHGLVLEFVWCFLSSTHPYLSLSQFQVSDLINCGVYVFTPKIFSIVQDVFFHREDRGQWCCCYLSLSMPYLILWLLKNATPWDFLFLVSHVNLTTCLLLTFLKLPALSWIDSLFWCTFFWCYSVVTLEEETRLSLYSFVAAMRDLD